MGGGLSCTDVNLNLPPPNDLPAHSNNMMGRYLLGQEEEKRKEDDNLPRSCYSSRNAIGDSIMSSSSSANSHTHNDIMDRLNGKLTLIRATKLINCGIVSGLTQAVVFNPWDRALYLSVKNETPFLSRSNFTKPMDGVLQTLAHRALSAGLYFPLEEIFTHFFRHTSVEPTYKPYLTFVAGTLAGISNGFLLNPFARIKVSHSIAFPFNTFMSDGSINSIKAGDVMTILQFASFQ